PIARAVAVRKPVDAPEPPKVPPPPRSDALLIDARVGELERAAFRLQARVTSLEERLEAALRRLGGERALPLDIRDVRTLASRRTYGGLSMSKTLTATELRQNLYRVIDEVLATGRPCRVVRGKRAVLIEPERPKGKKKRDLSKLTKRDIGLNCTFDELV